MEQPEQVDVPMGDEQEAMDDSAEPLLEPVADETAEPMEGGLQLGVVRARCEAKPPQSPSRLEATLVWLVCSRCIGQLVTAVGLGQV